MSRSGYSEDCENLAMWRGQVASAIRGKRGQAFLRDLIAALDAMPEKRLIADDLQRGGEVCALGSVGVKRGIDMTAIDPEDHERLAREFGIAHQLVQEIEWMNDEWCEGWSPEKRWEQMRKWAVASLRPTPSPEEAPTPRAAHTRTRGKDGET